MNENKKRFLRFATTPLMETKLDMFYKRNDIVFERVDLYKDFILSINNLIQETYLGDDVSDDLIKKQHFDWCWRKVCGNYEHENIYFVDNQELYQYFKRFFNRTYYSFEDKENPTQLIKIGRVWEYIFDCNQIKPPEDLDVFADVYRKFEKSFKNS